MSYLPDVDSDLDLLDSNSKRDYCSVVEGTDCQAIPGLSGRTACKCFACGQPACKSCSLVTKYLRYGSQRVCFNCIRQGMLGTVARGQMTLLGSRETAYRAHGQAVVERAIMVREKARRRGQ